MLERKVNINHVKWDREWNIFPLYNTQYPIK